MVPCMFSLFLFHEMQFYFHSNINRDIILMELMELLIMSLVIRVFNGDVVLLWVKGYMPQFSGRHSGKCILIEEIKKLRL